MMVRRMYRRSNRPSDRKPNFHNRRGVSLVEMMVVIAVTTVITTLGATLIATLMRSEGDGARSLARSTNLARLARDFRRDVRASSDAQFVSAEPEQPPEMVLQLAADATVVYRLQDDAVVRLERRDGENVALETYPLPEGERRFDQADDDRLLALVYRRPAAIRSAGGSRIPHHDFHIEAALGRDLRFAPPDRRQRGQP